MKVHEKLKLNRFKEVRIPSKMEYFKNMGLLPDTGMYDENNNLEPGRKTDILAEMESWDRMNKKPDVNEG